jgi:hypothetical protein
MPTRRRDHSLNADNELDCQNQKRTTENMRSVDSSLAASQDAGAEVMELNGNSDN